MIIFVDNLFFTWTASQWAVRLLWQPSDCMAIFVIFVVLLSENKYDDDDDDDDDDG